MANRVSNDQLEELLGFLADHPTIAKGVGLGARSKEAIDKQWNDLAIRLNSYGSGSSKSGERWKKYWADLKHKSKTKLAKRRRDAVGTGGGPSSQDDLSEIDKKVLAIIGEQAVFGDTVHRVPLFNVVTETQQQQQEEQETSVSLPLVDLEILNSESENFNMELRPPLLVNSPQEETSRQGQTTQVFTDNPTEIGPPAENTVRQTQQPQQCGVESHVSRTVAERPRLRRNRANISNPSRISPEWVMELERSRVEAENKLANAALIMAEAAKIQAETLKQLLEIVRIQSGDINEILKMMCNSQKQ